MKYTAFSLQDYCFKQISLKKTLIKDVKYVINVRLIDFRDALDRISCELLNLRGNTHSSKRQLNRITQYCFINACVLEESCFTSLYSTIVVTITDVFSLVAATEVLITIKGAKNVVLFDLLLSITDCPQFVGL